MKTFASLIGALLGIAFATAAPATSPEVVVPAAAAANPAAPVAAQPAAPVAAEAAVPDATAPDAAALDAAAPADAGPYADLAEDAVIEIDPVPYPEGVTYRNPPPATKDEIARIGAALKALTAEIPTLDYERARFHPLHFPPMVDGASNEQCLACHKEIVTHTPRDASPAGVPASATMAWYQTLDTYVGPQADFHFRHMGSDFARKVMNLECTFCHKGNDPREESPDLMPGRASFTAPDTPEFTLRKMVNPSETCLLCHGAMPDPVNIMGLGGDWHEVRADMETPEAPNGCMSCHAETFRTNRHQVDYLNAANIEELARTGTSDSCYGCHGGRAWYRNSFPYARNPWPGMDTETTPDWALNRPVASRPEHQLPPAAE